VTGSLRERRWPVALAVLVLIAFPAVLPDRLRLGPPWLLPTVGGIFLIALVAVDPTGVGRRRALVRTFGVALTALLIAADVYMTVRLTIDLINGGPSTANASTLLASGSVVWLNNTVLFGLLYWELDGGGPAVRARATHPYPDLGFQQQINPDLAPPDWRPAFADYFYLGLTNALAFSPTDVMPLAAWAKLTMALQAIISFVVIGLVLARAVNILS